MARRSEPRRSSVRRATSVPEKEAWYRHECDEIARRRGVVIYAEGGATHIDAGGGSKLLCRPLRPDRLWYETWLALEFGDPA